jgi:hypothetical protein
MPADRNLTLAFKCFAALLIAEKPTPEYMLSGFDVVLASRTVATHFDAKALKSDALGAFPSNPGAGSIRFLELQDAIISIIKNCRCTVLIIRIKSGGSTRPPNKSQMFPR